MEEKYQEENVIESNYHTLFIEDLPDRFEHIEDDDNSNLYLRFSGTRKYTLYLGDFEADNQKENFKIFSKLSEAHSDDELTIRISSIGGSFMEVVEFYNIIKSKFKEITTVLNYGYSGGSLIFLAGDIRAVYEHSDFMAHTYSGGVFGKRQDMIDQAMHQDKAITSFFKKMYSPYFSKKELKQMHKGKEFWLDSKEMLERGIATHIITDKGEVLEAKEYLDSKKSKKSKKKEL